MSRPTAQKVRGASATRPTRQTASIHWAAMLARLCKGILVGVLCMGLYVGFQQVKPYWNQPVSNVSVVADYEYVSQQVLSGWLQSAIQGRFFDVRLTQVKQTLEAKPWIDKVSVGRRWPSTIEVIVVEQKPIARWGETGFINRRGEVIDADMQAYSDNAVLDDLPELMGPKKQSPLLMQRYEELTQLLRSRQLTVDFLLTDAKGAWQVTLNNGMTVVLGRDDFLERMQRFLTVYDQYLHKDSQRIVKVDARYGNGVAVEWRPQNNSDEVENVEA